MKENKNVVLPGQMAMDINAARTPPTVKTVTPSPRTEQAATSERKKHYVQGEVLTESDLKNMTLRERNQYEREKDAAYLQKAREEQERVKELRRKYKEPKNSVDEPKTQDLDEVDEDDGGELAESTSENKYIRKQKNVCKKYKIKQSELRRGVERARELFVGKMLNSEKQRVVLAIIDLLEFGDIK